MPWEGKSISSKKETMANTLRIETHGPDYAATAAEKILHACPNDRIFAIYGPLGAGKTTLVKGFAEVLGSKDIVNSPTFSIVNEYDSPHGSIFHFDFYRIKHLEEVYDLGYEEYFFSGDYCFVEWPELIGPLIPEEAVLIRIINTGPLNRVIELTLQ